MNFSEALQQCIDKNLIFAAYRLPHSDATRLVIQKNPKPIKVEIETELFEKEGFLIAPFSKNNQLPNYFIQPDLNYNSSNYINFEELEKLAPIQFTPNAKNNEEAADQSDYEEQIKKIQSGILTGEFEKIVLSRTKIIAGDYRDKLVYIFEELCNSYPNAFVYVFNVADQMWIGATPEPLINSQRNELTTVSLAGTKEYCLDSLNLHNWSNKERIEQDLVTKFIKNTLQKNNIIYESINGPYTKKAGNLVHLRTDFVLDFEKVNGTLGSLINDLHPTPAVCGLPKDEAMNFLNKTEKHFRKYYAGFLGPINIDERILFFVNLRCMQIFLNQLLLYVGAGITQESVPTDEWIETEIKADTLLSIINTI